MTRIVALIGAPKPVDTVGHDAQRVDVETGVGLIEDCQTRLEHRHLEDLVALLLATREAEVDRAAHDLRTPLDHLELALEEIDEIHRVDLLLTSRLPQLVVRGAQEVGVRDAGDLDGVLEGKKDTGLGTLLGLEIEQILAQIRHRAGGHGVGRVTGQHLRERALARAVGTHDGMHLAGVDREVNASEDFLVARGSVQISDFEQAVTPSLAIGL